MAEMLAILMGTRPEVIKLAPVVWELERRGIPHEVWAVTQHSELLETALKEFRIEPDYRIEIPRSDPSLLSFSEEALGRLELLFKSRGPWAVIVQGDTVTAWLGAYVAFLRKVPVFHVEAGVRSLCLAEPFPEEALRRWIDEVAEIKFCPTNQTWINLWNENLEHHSYLVGNTGIDALKWALEEWGPVLDRYLKVEIDLHRREHWGKIPSAIRALSDLARDFPRWQFCFVLHPAVASDLPSSAPSNCEFLKPLSYANFCRLLRESQFCVTDSGGVQEEAAYLGIPCLVARDHCDRPESVNEGIAIQVGSNPEEIAKAVGRLIRNEAWRKRMARPSKVFGDGTAARKIGEILEAWVKDFERGVMKHGESR